MFRVKSLKEAEHWFLSHSEGSLICVNNGNEKEVNCYSDAEDFYNTKPMRPHKVKKLIEYLCALEESIERVEKTIQQYQIIPQATIDKIDTSGSIAKVIKIYEENIVQYKETIKNTIKNNPELEPHWIMHQMTK